MSTIEDTQVQDEQEVDTEATENGEGTKRTRTKAQYLGKGLEMEALDDLPENARAGRSQLYFAILEAVAADEDNLGKWHPIAKFGTDTGANSVKAQMNKQVAGKVMTEAQAELKAKDRPAEVKGWITPDQVREIPEYDGWHFEFEARKVPAESGKIGARDSILYARLVENEA